MSGRWFKNKKYLVSSRKKIIKMEFKLDKAQENRLKEWQDKIKELFGKYGQYDYIFTPCAIGTTLRVVSHLTKTELDLSEVEKW